MSRRRNVSNEEAHTQEMAEAYQKGGSPADQLRATVDLGGRLGIFGRRIVVPPNEIHVVSSGGATSLRPTKEARVYGVAADEKGLYWSNGLTVVIPLKTTVFVIPVERQANVGVDVLDKNHVPFTVIAHVVAKLDIEDPQVAAQSIGQDTDSLVSTIQEVTEAQLIHAAANMALEEVIQNRQALADKAREAVNETLSQLGYILVLLTIAEVGGEAYQKLIDRANAEISKDATIQINAAQLTEGKDVKARERTEAEVTAETTRTVSKEQLEATRDVETTRLSTEEEVQVESHKLALIQAKRDKTKAEAQHEVDLRQVALAEKEELAQAEKSAAIKKKTQEREKEVLELAELADAKREKEVQDRKIILNLEKTEAEAERLREQNFAAAELAREVALKKAESDKQVAEKKAEAEARALIVTTEAKTSTDLLKAERESTAAGKRAEATKLTADADRVKTAAPGLAKAEVDKANLSVEEKGVEVTEARGMAKAKVDTAQAKADAERERQLRKVELDALKRKAEIYKENPELLEIEHMKIRNEHAQTVAKIEAEARVSSVEAIAPHMNINIVGDGGRLGEIVSQAITLGQGLQIVGEQPTPVGALVSKLTSGNGQMADGQIGDWGVLSSMISSLQNLKPFIKTLVAETDPRMWSTLSIGTFVDNLIPVLTGQEKLTAALAKIRDDANFRLIANFPAKQILNAIGINFPNSADDLQDQPEQSEEASQIEEDTSEA